MFSDLFVDSAKTTVNAAELEAFDVHVIGSGIGGLTTAVLLAKVFGKKVCVLEQHWTPGGQTQTFTRKSGEYEWDVGVHYVGQMQGDQLPAKLMRFLTDNQLKWRPMDQGYDRIHFNDRSFQIRSSQEQYFEDLITAFPQQKRAIKRYFKDVKRASRYLILGQIAKVTPTVAQKGIKLLRQSMKRWSNLTTAQYFDQLTDDQELKNLLTSQWFTYGVAPEHSAFTTHAVVLSSYFDGAFYPQGGSQSIAKHLLSELNKHGGRCYTNAKVTEIGEKQDCLSHLNLKLAHHTPKANTLTIDVKQVHSDAGSYNTYRKLLSPQRFTQLEQLPWHASALVLYFGMDCNPSELGLNNTHYWFYNRDAAGATLSEEDEMLFVSFPSLKNGQQHGFSGEVICNIHPSLFTEWQQSGWKKRGKDYREFKNECEQNILDALFVNLPPLESHVTYHELATPLTLEFFTQQHRGNMYGVPCLPKRDEMPYCQAVTPIKNLYLTGQDVFCLGIGGALMGSMFSTLESMDRSTKPGRSYVKMMSALNKASKMT